MTAHDETYDLPDHFDAVRDTTTTRRAGMRLLRTYLGFYRINRQHWPEMTKRAAVVDAAKLAWRVRNA